MRWGCDTSLSAIKNFSIRWWLAEGSTSVPPILWRTAG